MRQRYELWVCCDCMTLQETGDATSFDYHYSESEAASRIEECEAGWAALRKQGEVFNDCTNEDQLVCIDCDHICGDDDPERIYVEEWDENQTVCPNCQEFDSMRDREHGEDEFSRSECDCCGSSLAGSRHRYALFVETPAAVDVDAGGAVVSEQVE